MLEASAVNTLWLSQMLYTIEKANKLPKGKVYHGTDNTILFHCRNGNIVIGIIHANYSREYFIVRGCCIKSVSFGDTFASVLEWEKGIYEKIDFPKFNPIKMLKKALKIKFHIKNNAGWYAK